MAQSESDRTSGLPSQEGSGLKHECTSVWLSHMGLPSQEGSGLKHFQCDFRHPGLPSSLARGKWIEADRFYDVKEHEIGSSLARGKWIEAGKGGMKVILNKVFPRKREVD